MCPVIETQGLSSNPFTEDGKLRIVEWANGAGWNDWGTDITVNHDPRPVRMAHSPATGQPLVSNGQLGVDLIRLAAGSGFAPHTHPGDHLLICVAGKGTITYDGYVYETCAGQVYLIAGEVAHAVGAITDHCILAVGSPHKGVGDPDRMALVAYHEVAARTDNLTCLICNTEASFPDKLCDAGCPHCPCLDCNPVE